MSGRRLARAVHVRDEHGRSHVFLPGRDVPAWAEVKITNPTAWADTAPQTSGTTNAATPTAVSSTLPPPPRHGKGSGREPWARYAADRGVVVTAQDTRDHIIDRLVDAGLPIE